MGHIHAQQLSPLTVIRIAPNFTPTPPTFPQPATIADSGNSSTAAAPAKISKPLSSSSPEGKFARNWMKWNSDSLTNLECKKGVKRLRVTLEGAGKPAISRSCTIWVEVVEKRKFKI